MSDRLTNQQETFCQLMVYGKEGRPIPAIDCYRSAYNYTGSNIHTKCFELKNNPKIKARLDELTLEKNRREHTSNDRLRSVVLQRLELEAMSLDNPPSVRVRALQLLGEVTGVDLFRDKKAVPDRSAGEIEAELKALIEAGTKGQAAN